MKVNNRDIIVKSNGIFLYLIWIVLSFNYIFGLTGTALALDLDYTIIIDDQGSHKAQIVMKVGGINSSLLTITEVNGPEAYGINVISLNAKDNAGNPISVNHIPRDGCKWEPDSWEINSTNLTSIEVNYVIEVTRLLCNRDEYYGYISNAFSVLLGSYLFLLPEDISSLNSVKVRCSLPSGWEILTPWPQTDGVYDPYSPYKSNFRTLFGWSIWCFGEFDVSKIRINTDEVIIAVYNTTA
jgi:hypothetical protein